MVKRFTDRLDFVGDRGSIPSRRFYFLKTAYGLFDLDKLLVYNKI